MKKYLFLFSVLLTFCIGCMCDYEVVFCPPDQRPVNFPKNQKCAKIFFEDSVSDLVLTTEATIDVIGKINVDIRSDVGVKSKILKEKLNQESIRLQNKLKLSFLTFSIDPCGNAERHYKLVQAIHDKDFELQKLKLEFESKSDIQRSANYLYIRGKRDGENMSKLVKSFEVFYAKNQKFPSDLAELEMKKTIDELSESRLELKNISPDKIQLSFAGEDFALGTDDDKVYVGENGRIKQID